MEELFDELDAPVVRVTGKDVPLPYAANLEKLALPTVDDVVDAFWRASSRGAGLVINIGTGRELSVNDLFADMAAVTGTATPAVLKPARPGELLRSCLDVRRASAELGWTSWTQFSDGAARCIEFVASQLATES